MYDASLALEGLVRAGRWEWQVHDNTLRWSPELSRIYGLAPGEAPDGYEAFLELVYPDDREHTQAMVQRALEERRDTEYRHRIVRSDGAVRVLRSLVTVDTDANGEVVKLSGACQDVTEHVALEQRLTRLQGLASAGSVAVGLAHDLKNLLAALVLFTGAMARHRGELPESMMEKIDTLAARSATIASRIQQIAQRSSSEAGDLDLRVEVERVTDVLEHVLGDTCELVVTASTDVGRVHLNRTDLERVLWNLVLNARDAESGDGHIFVNTERVTVVGAGHAGDYYRITIRDEGVGMDEVACARLFEPFYTTKGDKGTGLGLAVVLDIVEGAGGFVTVDSRLGEGTSIRVHLPPSDETAQTS